jgi:hypothetical protein
MAGTGSQNLLALLPTTDDYGEIYNLHEDGSVAKGQLRRFLKIIGPKFDEMKGLVDAWPTMIDVDSTDSDFLGNMAALVGVRFNREIPIPQQREEIKGAVQWYKRKGLLIGSRIHGYRISRLQTDIVEFWRNVKTSNRTYSHSSDNAGEEAALYKLPGDHTAFSYDYENQSLMPMGGEVASSETTGHEAWRVLDGQEATSWIASGAAPAYWEYHFGEEILPVLLRLRSGWGIEKFRLQWSDDGFAWNDAAELTFGSIQEYTENKGIADGTAQQFIMLRVPIAPNPAPIIYETGAYGPVDTELLVAVAEGATQISVRDAGGLSRHDWIELYSSTVGFGYYQIDKIEGNYITLTTAISERGGFPVLSSVKSVTVVEKNLTTDYTIDTWEGILTLVAGQFTPGNRVFSQYTAITDKHSVDV